MRSKFRSEHGYQLGNSTVLGEINSTLFNVYRRQLNKFDNPLKYIPVESNHNIMGNFRIHILFTIWDGHWAYETTLLCNYFDLTYNYLTFIEINVNGNYGCGLCVDVGNQFNIVSFIKIGYQN